jgi:anti-sigma B factor antagonist
MIDERLIGAVTILDVHGPMVMSAEAKPVSDTVRRLIDQGRVRFVVNLSRVAFIDSLGIGDIVRGFTAARRAGGSLTLCCVHDRIQTVLDATQLNRVIESFDTEQQAVERLAADCP